MSCHVSRRPSLALAIFSSNNLNFPLFKHFRRSLLRSNFGMPNANTSTEKAKEGRGIFVLVWRAKPFLS